MTGDASGVRTVLTRAGRTFRPSSSSPPIRQALADRRELLAEARTRSGSPLSTLRHYSGTTPGKLVIFCAIACIALLSTGWYGSGVLKQRTDTLKTIIDRSEPLAEASQVLYSSLSIADAAANSAFISGGVDSPELRSRYSDALATAAAALMRAAGNSGDPGSDTNSTERAVTADLSSLATTMPVYSGLIETARTNNRLGNPVGSAYLGEASGLMQDEILPAAQRLYERRYSEIADPQSTLTVPPYGVYIALLVVILGLIAISRFVTRRTRRRFNLGVVAALIAIIGGLTWLLATGLLSVAATSAAKTDGADPLRELTEARILTQQARSAETLSLVRRSDQRDVDSTFAASTSQIESILTRLGAQVDGDSGPLSREQLDSVARSLTQWKQSDTRARTLMQQGDFSGARALTVGTAAQSTATAYAAVDSQLITTITSTRTEFRDDINTAQRLLGFTGTGVAILTIFAAVALVLGMIPRVREFR